MRKSVASVPPSSTSSGRSGSVLINPKFRSSTKSVVHINPKFTNVHVNPNYTGRALPPLPHLNPEFFLDPSKAASYRESIQRAVEGVDVVFPSERNSGHSAQLLPKPRLNSQQKENRTPSFKKIGQRKLIRIRRSSNPANSANPSSSSFKKIGSRKLIRIRSQKDPVTPAASSAPKKPSSPIRVYKVRSVQALAASPPAPSVKERKSLSSRLLSRRPGRTPFSRILNPFKLDKRRTKITSPLLSTPNPNALLRRTSPTLRKNGPKSPPMSATKKKVIGEETYLVTTTSLKKLPPPPKPARSTAPTPKMTTSQLITVQGVKYNVSDNGRKLQRIVQPPTKAPVAAAAASSSASSGGTNGGFGVSKKLFLEGEEYVEDEPGVLVRSHNSMTRQSITNYRNRSINTIIKSQTRAKQYCMFYNKFGKCNKREKGVCPYIHDPEKVAVCRKFLHGNCHNESCLLSHEVSPDKMPSCKFFLEGLCSRENCPYRHIKVNAAAEVCPEFMKGFCSQGENCRKSHAYVDEARKANPEEEEEKQVTPKPKKVAPVKPKRKSLGNTPSASAAGKKARLRYYEEERTTASTEVEEEGLTSEYVLRRKRILKKVELAKQGWTGVARLEENPVDLDDSGPYAEIDEDEPSRPPVGELPSFISLSRYESSDEEPSSTSNPSAPHPPPLIVPEENNNNYEERLI